MIDQTAMAAILANGGEIDAESFGALAGAGLLQQAGTFLLGQNQAVQPIQPTAEQRQSAYTPVYIAAGIGVVLLLVILFVLFKK